MPNPQTHSKSSAEPECAACERSAPPGPSQDRRTPLLIKKKLPRIKSRPKMLSVRSSVPTNNKVTFIDKKINAAKPAKLPNNFVIILSEIIKNRMVLIGPR